MADTVKPVIPVMDPRSLVCFCPGCATTYETTGLAIGDVRCETCEDHGQQLVLEVRRYQDVKAKKPEPSMCDKLCEESTRKFQEETILKASAIIAETLHQVPTMKGEPCSRDGSMCQEGHCTECAKNEPSVKLSKAEQKVMEAIRAKPGQTGRELTMAIGYKSTIGTIALVRDLIQKDLVTKKADQVDGRIYRYYPKEATS